jgi:nickel transport protein
MKTFAKFLAVAALSTGMIVMTGAYAHGIWFAQRSNQLAMIYGVGADDLDAVKRLPKVTSITGYDESGKPVETKLEATTDRLLLVNLDNQPAIVAGVLDNGNWSKTADGKWHNKGKDEVPDAVISERTRKFAVHLRLPLTAPLGPLPEQTLQIVPVNAKLPELMGQPIKLKVLYKGKPVAGARVLHDFVNDPDGKPVKSAKDGSVTLKVRNQGLNVIGVLFDSPPEDPLKTNKVENFATLSFVLPHKPE